MLYIVAGMEDELAGLQRELDAHVASAGVGFPLDFLVAGIGPERSGQTVAAALANGKGKPSGVLMLGVAGALEPGRETGELILAGGYARDGGLERMETIAADEAMLEVAEAAAAEERMPVTRGNSLTVDHLICEEWERRQLREKYGTDSVNMEDHAVASAAKAVGVPFLSVRVVLDTAEQKLPGYLPKLSKGRGAVISEVLVRPWRIPVLRKLRSQMELCQTVLTRFGISYLKLEAERRKGEKAKETAEAIY